LPEINVNVELGSRLMILLRTFHEEKIPLGSVRYSRGVVSFASKPMTSVAIPNGRTPPDCVYFCWMPAM
jgi:hypothetical protein